MHPHFSRKKQMLQSCYDFQCVFSVTLQYVIQKCICIVDLSIIRQLFFILFSCGIVRHFDFFIFIKRNYGKL